MPGKTKGGGRGESASSSSSAPSHIATKNQFAALLLESDDEPDESNQEKHQEKLPEVPAPKRNDEKVDRDEEDKARSSSTPERPRPSSSSTISTPTLRRPLFFLDLEMTGLDPDHDSILEIAVIATDGDDLDKRVVGPSVAITTSKEQLAKMNAWCVDHHGRSGLTGKCLDSASSVPLEEAERMVCDFVKKHRPPPRERRRNNRKEQGGDDENDGDDVEEEEASNGGKPSSSCQLVQDKAILAGNSIHTDLSFIRKHMPRLASLCSYRLVDVSCLAELARRWSPAAFYSAPEKRNAHEALKDVEDSIEELKYYRRVLFKSGSEVSKSVAKWGARPRRGG